MRARAGALRACLAVAVLGARLLMPAAARAETPPVDVHYPESSPELWAGASIGWDARLEAVSLFKRYTLGDRDAWFSGQGAGAGASVSIHFRPPAALAGAAVTRWVELELGLGNSTHYVAWKEGDGVRPEATFMHTQSSAIAGVHFASGRSLDASTGSPWSGAVLGVAWLPTYVHFFGNDELAAQGKFHPAGLRLTVDWGRIIPTAKGRVPGLRAVLTWLPYVGSLPTTVSAGVGCVFY